MKKILLALFLLAVIGGYVGYRFLVPREPGSTFYLNEKAIDSVAFMRIMDSMARIPLVIHGRRPDMDSTLGEFGEGVTHLQIDPSGIVIDSGSATVVDSSDWNYFPRAGSFRINIDSLHRSNKRRKKKTPILMTGTGCCDHAALWEDRLGPLMKDREKGEADTLIPTRIIDGQKPDTTAATFGNKILLLNNKYPEELYSFDPVWDRIILMERRIDSLQHRLDSLEKRVTSCGTIYGNDSSLPSNRTLSDREKLILLQNDPGFYRGKHVDESGRTDLGWPEGVLIDTAGPLYDPTRPTSHKKANPAQKKKTRKPMEVQFGRVWNLPGNIRDTIGYQGPLISKAKIVDSLSKRGWAYRKIYPNQKKINK